MKTSLIALLFVLCTLNSFSQKKKEIKTNKIKSITVWNAEAGINNDQPYRQTCDEFDKEGRNTSSIEYKPDGTISKKETSKYDKFGNLIENIKYNEKDKKSEKTIFKYNANNDKTEEVEYVNDILVKKTLFTYNANGDKTKETTVNADGKTIKQIIYTYNTKQLKESRQTISNNKNESLKKYLYEYY